MNKGNINKRQNSFGEKINFSYYFEKLDVHYVAEWLL